MKSRIIDETKVYERKTCDQCSGEGVERPNGFPRICDKCMGDGEIKILVERYSKEVWDLEKRISLAV